jgi:NADPH-dependent 2,4-dienoyl-CoA reductase/sulfur reductase-like enzyme
MKVIIVGGIAGGASCAARLRGLDEDAEILLIERGPFISYAHRGLPYHVSGIHEMNSPLFATVQPFKTISGIDCMTNSEVIGISTKNKAIQIQNIKTDAITVEKYDKLVLSPASVPMQLPVPGFDLPGIFSLSTLPDPENMNEWLCQCGMEINNQNSINGFSSIMKLQRAIVAGGGFAGVEMAENLVRLGLEVTLIEKLNQVMPSLDPEMARIAEIHLINHGVKTELNEDVASFAKCTDGSLEVSCASGKKHVADIVILAAETKADTCLAKMAGVEVGMSGGIRVDEHMLTSNPDIFAVGDSIEVRDLVSGQWTLMPISGHENRQGRIAAEVLAGRNSHFRGIQRISICNLLNATVAQTGMSEKVLIQTGCFDFEKIYVNPGKQAVQYPGAKMKAVKIIFRKSDGHLLGAQVIGEEGVASRIEAYAMAIQMGSTIFDLEEAGLSSAPFFEGARDSSSHLHSRQEVKFN